MEARTKFKRNLMLDTAFQIFDANLDTDSLFEEVCSLSKKFKGNSDEAAQFDRVLSMTLSHVHKAGCNLSRNYILSTPWIAQRVISLAVQCNTTFSPLCPDFIEGPWATCLGIARDSIRQNNFIPDLFMSMLSQCTLPLEMMWSLHTIGAFDLRKYLTSKATNDSISEWLASNLLQLCHGTDKNEPKRTVILSGVLSLVIKMCFGDTGVPGDAKMFQKITDIFLAGLLRLQIKNEQENFISPFNEIVMGQMTERARQAFCLHGLSQCFRHDADTTISESLGSLSGGEPLNDVKLSAIFKQLLRPLGSQDTLDFLKRCLECDQVNVQMSLHFMLVFLALEENNGLLCKEMIRSVLSTSLQASDVHQTVIAFYIARQCCCVNSPVFPSYRDWFQGMFGDGTNSPASTRVSFSFLVKCLREWVPQESGQYLKAHVLRKPFIPARMKDLYDSYILLAKTRLSDLKVSLNDLWFENSSDTPSNVTKNHTSLSDSTSNDIDLAVRSYGETGRVPTSILEASIFRKPYFVGKFLPSLLKPRCLPDMPDTKMKLIEEIRKSGRIPASMHTYYLEGCDRERQALLEGVFDLDDDDAEDEMILQPMEQLQFQLDRLIKAALNKDVQKIQETLSFIRERIEAVLPDAVTKAEESDVIKITVNGCTNELEEQIIIKALHSLTQTTPTLSRKNDQMKRSFLHDSWQMSFIRNIISFSALKPAFISFVIINLNKNTTHDGISMATLAMVCISLRFLLPIVNFELSGLTKDKNKSSGDFSGKLIYADFVNLFFDCLNHSLNSDLLFSFRFLVLYVKEALQYLQDIEIQLSENDILMEAAVPTLSEAQLLPASLIKQVNLLSRRFSSCLKSSRLHDKSQASSSILEELLLFLKSDAWVELSKKWEPSSLEWIQFELHIDPCSDCMAATQRYSHYETETRCYLHTIGTSVVCSQLYAVLASHCPSDTRNTQVSVHESIWTDFFTLLKSLLLQLPLSAWDDKPWLLTTLNSCDGVQRPAMLRLLPRLPPFLLLSNSNAVHEEVIEKNVAAAVSVLDMLAASDMNEGGYLSLDMTITLSQAYTDHYDPANPTSHTCLVQLLTHPLMFTSILVYKERLEDLGILKHIPEDWLSLLRCNILNNGSDRQRIEGFPDLFDVSADREWMKAAAIFATISHGTIDQDSFSNIFQFSQECQLYVLEFIVIFFFHNLPKLDQPHALKSHVHTILLTSPQLLEHWLRSDQFLVTQWRHRLGVHESGRHLRTFCILRLCCEIAGKSLISLSGKGIPSLILAYTELLQNTHQDLESYAKISLEDLNRLSSWLKQMVDVCSAHSYPGVNYAALRKCDPLLYRHIQLHLGK